MSLGTILGAVGTVVGFYFGGPVGAQIGAIAGSMIGNAIDPPKGARNEGQKLTDLTQQTVSYGTIVGEVYGRYLRAGNIFWASEKKQHKQVMETGDSKGGGGASTTNITYYYTMSFAIGLSNKRILGVKSIRVNGTKEYETDALAVPGSQIKSAEFEGHFTIYNGYDDQPVDPTMEAEDGVGNVPAYQGLAYVVFTDFNLQKYGNVLPNLIQFEVISEGSGTLKQATDIITVYNLTGGYITSQLGTSNSSVGEYFRNRFFINNLMIRDVDNSVSFPNLPIVTDVIDLKSTMMPTQFYVDGLRYYGSGSSRRDLEDISMSFDYELAKIYQYDKRLMLLDYQTTQPNFSFNDSFGFRLYGSIGRLNHSDYALYLNSKMIKQPFSSQEGYLEENHSNSVFSISYINVASPPNTSFNAIDKILPTGKFLKGCVISEDQTFGYIFYSDEDYTALSTVYCAKFVLNKDKISIIETSVFEEPLYFCGLGKANFEYLSGVPTDQRFDFCACDNKYIWLIASKSTAVLFENIGGIWTRKGSVNIATINSYNLNFYAKNGLLYVNDNVGSAIFSANKTIEVNKIFLSDVVSAQFEKVGLTPDLYDVSEISDIELDGYLIGSKASARSNIEILCNAYYFDIIDSDGKLKAKKRGRDAVLTITSDDFIIDADATGTSRSAFTFTKLQELSLPKEVQVLYMNLASDYALGAQYERRQNTSAVDVKTFNMPLLLSDDKASRVAEALLYTMHLESEVIKFSTDFKYVELEPTDVVNVIDYNNQEYTVRLVSKVEGDNGVIEWEAVRDQRSSYLSNKKGSSSNNQKPSQVSFIENTELLPMNLPLILDNQPDQNAYYLAVSAKTEGNWYGSVVYKSLDNINYNMLNNAVFTNNQNTTSGVASGKLLSNDCFNIDISSKLLVTLRDKNATLSSRTYDDLLTLKANYALINNEVVQFANAVLVNPGVYEISGFIRGLSGTEINANNHDDGEKFILLDMNKIIIIPDDLSSVGVDFWLSGVSGGKTFDKGDKKIFNNNGLAIKPLAPYSFLSKKSSGDFLITWYRRARKNAGLINNIEVPLDENTEAYIVEIYSDNTYTNVINEYSVVLKQDFTYTLAMQNSDFGSAQNAIFAKISQVSERIGRGFASIPKLQ